MRGKGTREDGTPAHLIAFAELLAEVEELPALRERDILACLTKKQAHVWMRSAINGLSIEEIMERLDLPHDKVVFRLKQAQAALRRFIRSSVRSRKDES